MASKHAGGFPRHASLRITLREACSHPGVSHPADLLMNADERVPSWEGSGRERLIRCYARPLFAVSLAERRL